MWCGGCTALRCAALRGVVWWVHCTALCCSARCGVVGAIGQCSTAAARLHEGSVSSRRCAPLSTVMRRIGLRRIGLRWVGLRWVIPRVVARVGGGWMGMMGGRSVCQRVGRRVRRRIGLRWVCLRRVGMRRVMWRVGLWRVGVWWVGVWRVGVWRVGCFGFSGIRSRRVIRLRRKGRGARKARRGS